MTSDTTPTPTPSEAWQTRSVLAAALLEQAAGWTSRPHGERYENGSCDSEISADVLRGLVKDSANEAQLFDGVRTLLAKRDLDASGRELVEGLYLALEKSGHAETSAGDGMSPRDWAARNRRGR